MGIHSFTQISHLNLSKILFVISTTEINALNERNFRKSSSCLVLE